jgi:hypothetical protein
MAINKNSFSQTLNLNKNFFIYSVHFSLEVADDKRPEKNMNIYIKANKKSLADNPLAITAGKRTGTLYN